MDTEDEARLSELVSAIDCFTEDDVQLIAGITPSTQTSWRRRGTGPKSIRVGNRYLYPKQAFREYVTAQEKERHPAVTAKDAL